MSQNNADSAAMQGMLQWLVRETPEAVSAAARSDGAALEPMSDERKQFLLNALSSLSKDYIAPLKDALQTLTSPDSSREDKVEALEIVAEECEDINVAQDFAKLGGMPLLLEWLGSGDAEILAHAASVVASLTQNNPGGLADVQAHNIFPFLRPLLRHEDEKVRQKALHAISCIVRGTTTEAEARRADAGESAHHRDMSWIPDVVACLAQPAPRVQVKAVHLLRHVAADSEALQAEVLRAGLLPALASALTASEDSQLWEQSMHLLADLASRRNSLLADLEREQPRLLQVMTARRSALNHLPADDKDAHREEFEYMKALLGDIQE